jgi:ABC-type nitrate/sulfonate/bicarbonate transport system permease component
MTGHWLLGIRGQVPRSAGIVLGTVPILLLLGLWWAVTAGPVEQRRVSPTILPNPAEVVQSVPDLLGRRQLFHNALISLKRIVQGYLVALCVVLPLGILMGAFGSFRSTFAPLTTASGYIPIASLVPLTMSWFGTDDFQKIMFLAIAFGIYLLPMIVSAIEDVPDVYLRTAYTLGASRWTVIFRVLVPVALPAIWQGMRLAFGVGWTYLVLTEVVTFSAQDAGLGVLIAMSQRRGPREHIYLVIVAITVIAWIADLAWTRLGMLLFPYKGERR